MLNLNTPKSANQPSWLRPLTLGLLGASLFTSLACGGNGGAFGQSIVPTVDVTVVNYTSVPNIKGNFSGLDIFPSLNPIPYNQHSCAENGNSDSSNVGTFTVKNTASDVTFLTDTSGFPLTLDSNGPLGYFVYGSQTQAYDETIDFGAGQGSKLDFWVTDLSVTDASNHQVHIIDHTSNQDTQVTPVAGVDGSRSRFELGLTAGHSYTISLSTGTSSSVTVDFTAATSADPIVYVAAYVDDLTGGTHSLKMSTFAKNGCIQ